jgi:hypothetical protein
MSNEIEVNIGINGKRITLEGPEDFVRGEVRHLLGMLASSVKEETPVKQEAPGAAVSGLPRLSERQLFDQKKPRSQMEMVAVMAFCLALNGIEEFTEEDMRRSFIRAGVRPPQFLGQALRDARNKSDFISKGNRRGLYRLSTHGERTVRFDLPRESSKPVVETAPVPAGELFEPIS